MRARCALEEDMSGMKRKACPCLFRAFRLFPLCLAVTGVLAGDARQSPLVIEPALAQEEVDLIYGWSRAEPDRSGTTWRWIEKLEGELLFDLEDPHDATFAIEAKPLVMHKRIQNMGLFVNGRFIKEWVMGTEGAFLTYSARVSARHLRRGRNRLILRAGYKGSPGSDPRELSIAVRRIVIEPDDASGGLVAREEQGGLRPQSGAQKAERDNE